MAAASKHASTRETKCHSLVGLAVTLKRGELFRGLGHLYIYGHLLFLLSWRVVVDWRVKEMGMLCCSSGGGDVGSALLSLLVAVLVVVLVQLLCQPPPRRRIRVYRCS
ncbi:hypothetical protein MUK42_32735 [Musa troglodytarum]|uniref:Uncharacterized protein n=1 Tax=Musa troglodytarum TaxID=320322 RepID=A0A9E7ICE3_9LILI|nr:hypothetical protein MUK42_32735 [Musa troglodytarum]